MTVWGTAAFVFVFIVAVNIIFTLRLISITNGRRLLGLGFGFFESLAFATAFGRVLADLQEWPILISYCLAGAVGSYIGMILETRFVGGYVRVKIIADNLDKNLAARLRAEGYGVTESLGQGAEGPVLLLNSVCKRRDADYLIEQVRRLSPQAFITVEQAKTVMRGWMRSSAPLRSEPPHPEPSTHAPIKG